MSGLLALLQQSATSLQAQTAASSTASHNLSNANTVGYSRQRAELAAAAPAERIGNSYLGRGAVLQAVSQARDRFLEAQMPGAIAKEMASGTEAETLKSITAVDVDTGLNPALSNFYSSLRALAQNPGSQNYRVAAVSAASQLAFTFNQTASAIDGARTAIDTKLDGRLSEVSDLAAQVAQLNAAIKSARASGGEPNDLLDARLHLGDQLAEKIGAIPVADKDGNLNLTLPDGTSVVNATFAAKFSAKPDPTNGGHSAIWIQKPDGSPAQQLARPPGGEIGGLLSARDGALKKAATDVDQLAFEFASNVNTASRAGFALDGSTGRDLFGGVGAATNAARTIAIDPAIGGDPNLFPGGNTPAAGDGSAVQAIVATESMTLTSGTTVTGTLSKITSDFGASASRIASIHEADQAMLGHLDSMRQSASGVSIDEELINMQKAQRGYEAVTRVIKTADDMLETLMSLK
ncbi:MAG: flagellar hook-associated protein FlgK [Archangium sp.]